MILLFDTYYFDNKAKTVCISFNGWASEDQFEIHAEITEGIKEYKPGEFYQRELPCILSLFDKIEIKGIVAIVVDGYVYLDDSKKLGLGGYLYEHLGSKIPVIGVAKSNFATLNQDKREILRGKSRRPLYITSIGFDLDDAARLIKNMRGSNRIPDLLKKLDRLTKE